jgi:hypothetical protein
MSHELRTPLNATSVQVLRERLFGDVNEKQAGTSTTSSPRPTTCWR